MGMILAGAGTLLLALVIGYFLVGTGHVVVAFTRAAWLVYSARTLGPDGPQPATDQLPYLPYLLQQSWRDTATVLARARQDGWQRVSGVHHRFWGWFHAASPPATVAALPLAVGLVAGTGLVLVPVTAGLVALLAVPVTALVLWGVALLLVVATLGTAEQVVRLARRVVLACPHPGCYRRFPLPAYGCADGGCGRRHPRLVPGPFGLLRHACGCGASLPTLGLLGRHRLASYCPACHQLLPQRTGQVRIEHVPVIGGPDAGKTTLLCRAIGAWEQALASQGGKVDYPDPRDRARWRSALVDLRSGVRLPKTPVELPPAVMLDLRPRAGNGRILYLFDPAGEIYDTAELLDSQRHLDHAQLALVVVDPLAIPAVRRSLTAAEREAMALAGQAQLVREGPGDMIDRLLVVLRNRPGGVRLRRILVVVSKSDLLRKSQVGAGLAGPEPDVAGWLEEVGWSNWVRALAQCGDEVRYLASGLDVDDAVLLERLDWLVGAKLAGPAAGRARAGWSMRWRLRGDRAWRSSSRPELVPRGHVAGRLLMQVLAVPLALLAAAAAPAALAWWLWSLTS